ncbi:MAG: LysM peptidoglycan-binding domain-containing protein [Anaerolineae bacterium]
MAKNGMRPLLRGIMVLNILATVIVSASPHDVQAQQENLLRNAGFEQGWYDVSGTQQAPNEWKMHWTEGEVMGDANNVTARPESRVLPRQQVPPDEHSLFFWDGDYTLKMFWAKAPIHVGISQDVTGLEPGREYRLVVPTYVDTFNWEEGKVPPSDPFAAQVRLGAGPTGVDWRDEGAINFSNWANASNTSPFYLARTTLQFTFVATAPEMSIFVEFTSKWGLDNNGVFWDALRLEPLGMAQPPTSTPPPPPPTATPGPSPTPMPTSTPRPDGSIVHVVQSGDTLTSIALRYGVSVEDLLELNAGSIGANNLIRTGQELVISVPTVAPTSTPLPEPPTATPQPEASPSPTPEEEGASICVLAFHDRNGDTVRDPDNEELLPNVEFTLANASGVVAEYTSDGVSEPYCFSDLAAGSYRVVQQAPAGYETTGLPEQNVALAEGTSFDLQFGNARSTGEESPEATSEPAPSSDEQTPGGGGSDLFGGVLTTVARVAGILVLVLAGAIALLFFLGRRRQG